MSEAEMLSTLREFMKFILKPRVDEADLARFEATVRAVGEQLYRCGGESRMRDALQPLANIPQYRRIECIWSGIGEWRG
jgi:hypothetical protein